MLYFKRLFWRERWWASQIYSVTAPPLVLTMVLAFALGTLFAVVAFVLYQQTPEIVTYWDRLRFAAVYIPIFVFFTAGLTLVYLEQYGERLNERVPPPIFVDTNRPLRVVVDSAIQGLNITEEQPRARDKYERDYEVQEVIRSPTTGGISVLLQERRRECPEEGTNGKTRSEKNGKNGKNDEWVMSTWRVDADRWGRLQGVRARGKQSGPLRDDFPRAYGQYS